MAASAAISGMARVTPMQAMATPAAMMVSGAATPAVTTRNAKPKKKL